MQHSASEGETRLHAGRIAADAPVERVDDPKEGRAGLDRRARPEPVEPCGIDKVVASRQTVVQGRLGRDDATPAPDVVAVGTGRVDAERHN